MDFSHPRRIPAPMAASLASATSLPRIVACHQFSSVSFANGLGSHASATILRPHARQPEIIVVVVTHRISLGNDCEWNWRTRRSAGLRGRRILLYSANLWRRKGFV